MPRRKLIHPTRAVTFRIDQRVISQFELLLLDPLAQRSTYGQKSQIVEQLIQRLLQAAKTGHKTIVVQDLASTLLSN